VDTSGTRGKLVAGAAAAASVALWAAPNIDRSNAAAPPVEKDRVTQTDAPTSAKPQSADEKDRKRSASPQAPTAPDLLPPHS
jgi:hypothetical protein